VLDENPWEVGALHELSFTYFVKKDYEAALRAARSGAQCKSPALAGFYMMIGSALDELGKGKEAIDTYKDAIKLNPDLGLLHYNLAVSLKRAGKHAEAKTSVQQALRRAPDHANSHALLGSLYQEMGYRVPAILAYSRLLVIEQESPRTVQVLTALNGLLGQGVQKKNDGNIQILIADASKSRQDEGDFMGVETMMSILLAADMIALPGDKDKPKESPFEKLTSIYQGMGESLENSKPKGGFAAGYYAPYFAALVKAGHAAAFAAHAWRSAAVPGSQEWTQQNQSKADAFSAWSKAYRWPLK
jgi:tetratricopeptide (TPR) repeat protein